MSVTEIIGARYVPVFGRKDETDIAWDNSKPYEPLTIVTYNGNSYTSRQYVPSGISITNKSYWALTGNYDAQSAQLTIEVNKLSNDITDETNDRIAADNALSDRLSELEKNQTQKIIVWIGDSYTEAVSLGEDQYTKRFATLASDELGLIQKNYGVGGTGFFSGKTTESTFYDQLKKAANDTTFDNDEVAYVVISGGRNDAKGGAGYLYNNIVNKVNECVSYAVRTFTNASIIVVPMLWDAKTLPMEHYRWYLAIIAGALKNRCHIVYNAYTALTGFFDCILSDNTHPNVQGHRMLADLYEQSILYCTYFVHTPNLVKLDNMCLTCYDSKCYCEIATSKGYVANSVICQTTVTGKHCACYIEDHTVYLYHSDGNVYRCRITNNCSIDSINHTITLTAVDAIPNGTAYYSGYIPFGYQPYYM